MKRKAMEIDKSKIDRTPDEKPSAAYMSGSGVSGGMGRSGMDQDSTPTYARYAASCLTSLTFLLDQHWCG